MVSYDDYVNRVATRRARARARTSHERATFRTRLDSPSIPNLSFTSFELEMAKRHSRVLAALDGPTYSQFDATGHSDATIDKAASNTDVPSGDGNILVNIKRIEDLNKVETPPRKRRRVVRLGKDPENKPPGSSRLPTQDSATDDGEFCGYDFQKLSHMVALCS